MGSRGPLRRENSTRSEKERKRKRPAAPVVPVVGARPDVPAWLPADAAPLWDAVLRDLESAGVILQKVDSSAVGMYVSALLEAQKASAAGDAKLGARIARDAIAWAGQIGATPMARARLGVKLAGKRDPFALDDELAEILARPRAPRPVN